MRKLYLVDFAALLNVSVSTLRSYRSRGEAGFPEPDGTDHERGHARPWWHEDTAREWKAGRRGRGWWGSRRARGAVA